VRNATFGTCLSYFLITIILLNIFQSSVWCLKLLEPGEQNEYCNELADHESGLELIKISVKEYNDLSSGFLKLNDHEFIYQKKLYDVIHSDIANGFINFYCHNDSKEEIILNQITESVKAGLDYINSSNKKNAVSVKIVLPEYAPHLLNVYSDLQSNIIFYPEKIYPYHSGFSGKIDVPPEALIA
jgi:hypothetical protein